MSLKEAAEEMLKLYDSWPEQLLNSYRQALSAVRQSAPRPRSVVLCGMGGSGVTGDYVWAVGNAKGFKVPIYVHKADGVPPWVSAEDLVVAISYSGNTYETLSCAREARARGSLVASVTSGGKLAAWAEQSSLPLARVATGYYPRTALGELAGATFGVLKALGIDLVDDKDIDAAAQALRSTSRGEGEAMANALKGRQLYIVAGCGIYSIVAQRWRQELSENAKVIAKTEAYPESAHNDLVVWQVIQKANKGFIVVEGQGGICLVINELLRSAYDPQGDVVVRVNPRGEGPLAQLLQGSLLAGYTSVYLAYLNGTDPRSTTITGTYKELLEKQGFS